MALRLPLSSFETPPFVLNRIRFGSLSFLSGPSIRTFSPPQRIRRRKSSFALAAIGREETELSLPGFEVDVGTMEGKADLNASGELEEDASPEDLEFIGKIKRVLELLKKNRDMQFGETASEIETARALFLKIKEPYKNIPFFPAETFGYNSVMFPRTAYLLPATEEIKLTIMIEDPRDIERKRLLGIEDPDEITRDDLASALEDVHEGRIPKNRVALRLLAEEIISWPDLEVEASKKKRIKSQYAKATDTGVNPREAAKRLNIDWDSAADIEEAGDEDDDIEVPPAVGYGALYLVTALPLIIGVSVILVLFYNSLQ